MYLCTQGELYITAALCVTGKKNVTANCFSNEPWIFQDKKKKKRMFQSCVYQYNIKENSKFQK